jgi:predicted Zn-dependent protease
MINKRLTVVLTVMFISVASALANAYSDGWTAFLKNDFKDARALFVKAQNDAATASDAALSLALIDWMEGKYADGFKNFQQFYNSANQPYAALYAVSSLPILNKFEDYLSPEKVAFYEKIITDNNLNGTLQATTNAILANYYRFMNNDKKATEYLNSLGTIDCWQVLGVFDNTSGSGFVKDWDAVAKAKTTDVFKNNVNADVTWYVPVATRFDRWFDFSDYFDLDNTIIYAQSFVQSPKTQEVYLRAGTSGSLKVWINDALVASVSEERNCDLDVYGYKVKLQQGANRVLVQIGQSEIDRSNFMLRFTDENSRPIAGLTAKTEYANYQKDNSTYNTEALPFYPEAQLQKTINAQPENYLYKILLAQTYLRNDKAVEATSILKEMEEKFPKSTLVSYSLIEAYARAKNQTDLSREIEGIKTNDPQSYIGQQYKFSEEIDLNHYDEAEKIIKNIISLYGESEYTDNLQRSLAHYQDKKGDVIAWTEKLYKKYPYDFSYVSDYYDIESNKDGGSKKALQILEKYNKTYFDLNALSSLSDEYFTLGNTQKGIATLETLNKKCPNNISYLWQLQNQMAKMQSYSGALSYNDLILKQRPFDGDVFEVRGYIQKELGKKTQAIESFNRAIYLKPTAYDSREQVRQLENKKELFDLFQKFDLKQLIANAPKAADFPQDNSVILNYQKQMVVYPELAKEYKTIIVAKILTQAGIEDWKQYNAGGQIEKAEVLKANGTTVKAEGYSSVVFTNLEVDDVVHIEFKQQDRSRGALAQYFYSDFNFEYPVPVNTYMFSLLVPNDKIFTSKVTNGRIEPTISDIENMKLYTWEKTNVPAVRQESYMYFYDNITQLYLSSFPDWKFIANWYRDLTFSKFAPDYVFTDTYNKLIKGNENKTSLEKAEIFYNYIEDNITYSSVAFMQNNYIPQKPSRTITTRLGDCKDLSTLFVALCRQAGIDANLVLILTRNVGGNNLALPSIEFNHCIAQLNDNGKTYYIELTDNNLPFGALPYIDINAQILPIPFGKDAAGSELIHLISKTRPQNNSICHQNVIVNGNNMSIASSTCFVAAAASNCRNQYKKHGDDNRNKMINERVSAAFNKSVIITDLNFINLDNLKDTVTQSYRFDVNNVLQDVAGMKIFKLPWIDKNSPDLIAPQTRKYPLEYWAYQLEDIITEIMTLELPTGKTLVETPQNVSLDCANASYTLTFDTKQKGKLIATRIFTLKKDVVSNEEYPAFRSFLNQMNEADEKQFAIK